MYKTTRRKVLLTTIKKVLDYLKWEYEEDDGELYFVWHNLQPDTKRLNDDEVMYLLKDLTIYELN